MLWKVFQHSTCMSTYYQKYSNIDCVCQQTIESISTYRKYVKILSKVFWHSVSLSKDNQKYVKTLAKVCRKKKYVTALKSMSTTSKSMSQHTEYVKSSPIFLMRVAARGKRLVVPASHVASLPEQFESSPGKFLLRLHHRIIHSLHEHLSIKVHWTSRCTKEFGW